MKKLTAIVLLWALLLSACTAGHDLNNSSGNTNDDAVSQSDASTRFETSAYAIDPDSSDASTNMPDTPIIPPNSTLTTDGQTTVPAETDSPSAVPETTDSQTVSETDPITLPPMTSTAPVTTANTASPIATQKPETTKPVTTSSPITTVPPITTALPVTTQPIAPTVIPTLNTYFPIDNASHAVLVHSTAVGMSGEGSEKLFDSDPGTKLCTNTTGYAVTWKLDKAFSICGYSIQTASDTAQYGRIPTSWILEGSTDGNIWQVISDVSSGKIPQKDNVEVLFTVTAGRYSYFRFTLRAPSSMTQMSEITLYTDEIPQTPALEAAQNRTDIDQSVYASAGIALVKQIINDYYDRSTHTLRPDLGRTDASSVWGVAAFVEAMAEAYRLCPDDPLIYSVYLDALNNCVGTYKVQGKITTPTGQYQVTYYNATKWQSGDYYYDDDAWLCLQFLNAYELLGEEHYLELAEELLDFFWTGWDESLGGGIYWDKSFSSKNICDNGPCAIAYLRAYELTGNQNYLEKGKQIYDWCRQVLLENNLYSDNIVINGFINTWKAAYNQGTMLCVGALLYRITGEARYLTETTAVWKATISHMFTQSGGSVRMSGNPIYRSWCIGWLTRGFELYYTVDPTHNTEAMDKLTAVLANELKTKNYRGYTGYYDPYFCTGDWADQSMTDVIQPSGVATVFLLTGIYELNN